MFYMNMYEEVPFVGQPIITTRWVCTEKLKRNQLVCKARLVARGFEEDSSSLTNESPTCSKDSSRILLLLLYQAWDGRYKVLISSLLFYKVCH